MSKKKFVPSVTNLEDRISLSDTIAGVYPPAGSPTDPSMQSPLPTTDGTTPIRQVKIGILQGIATQFPSIIPILTRL